MAYKTIEFVDQRFMPRSVSAKIQNIDGSSKYGLCYKFDNSSTCNDINIFKFNIIYISGIIIAAKHLINHIIVQNGQKRLQKFGAQRGICY